MVRSKQSPKKREVDEAPTVAAFRLDPAKGIDQVEEKTMYRGWLPVDDDLDDEPESIGRLALEAFIRASVRK